MSMTDNIHITIDKIGDPRKGLGAHAVTKMLQAEKPDFFKNDVKDIEFGSDPAAIHIRCYNGDEYDYTVESVRTKLVKIEKGKKYRFKKIFTTSEIIDKYCEQHEGCWGSCPLNTGIGSCLNEKDAIKKLLKLGIIEEVKE